MLAIGNGEQIPLRTGPPPFHPFHPVMGQQPGSYHTWFFPPSHSSTVFTSNGHGVVTIGSKQKDRYGSAVLFFGNGDLIGINSTGRRGKMEQLVVRSCFIGSLVKHKKNIGTRTWDPLLLFLFHWFQHDPMATGSELLDSVIDQNRLMGY